MTAASDLPKQPSLQGALFVPKLSASCERLEGEQGGEGAVVAGRQGMTAFEVSSLRFGVRVVLFYLAAL